jgi:hypothetical protein
MHFNCLGWRYFHYYSVPRTRDVIQAVTEWNIQTFELMKAGERSLTMAWAYNVREGFTAADDVLPPRMAEPIESTAIDGWRDQPRRLPSGPRTVLRDDGMGRGDRRTEGLETARTRSRLGRRASDSCLAQAA